MNAELRVTLDQQMHVIGHDFQAQHFRLMLSTDLVNDLREPDSYLFSKYLAPVLGTPDHMVLAGIEHVAVGLVGHLAHRNSIQHLAIYCQWIVLPRFPSHLKKNDPYIPVTEAKGFTGRFAKRRKTDCPIWQIS